MNIEDLRKKAGPALKEVARMGVWDGVQLDEENGEPVVIAILRKLPIIQFLHKFKVIQTPELPERVQGIRCKVVFMTPLTKAGK